MVAVSDDVRLPDGSHVPIQDTVCECGHWYREHEGEPGVIGCGGFVADPVASSVEMIVAWGGDAQHWPDHVKVGLLLRVIREPLSGAFDGCEIGSDRRSLILDTMCGTFRLDVREVFAHDDWPLHRPSAPEAPIPGRFWYAGCNPDGGRIDPETGICDDCGESACRVCGRGDCPDHPPEATPA